MIVNSVTDLGPHLGAFTEGAKFIISALIAKNQKKIKGLQRVIRDPIAQRQDQLYNFWHVIFLMQLRLRYHHNSLFKILEYFIRREKNQQHLL